jgi:hypothetical protein
MLTGLDAMIFQENWCGGCASAVRSQEQTYYPRGENAIGFLRGNIFLTAVKQGNCCCVEKFLIQKRGVTSIYT